MKSIYAWGWTLHFFTLFLLLWAYAALTYGFLGVCLGWIPASVGAMVLSIIWPVVDLAWFWFLCR